ncbi:hypothetical protein HNQ44_000527 [Planomicrobium koreense]|uniref:Uncharacterized protein n=1 Tax=Planococcus koreensis TaxID=112331 RepID=A0A7W8CSD4_9BACL|nr:hypothetical protein [Planococcus koreensis]
MGSCSAFFHETMKGAFHVRKAPFHITQRGWEKCSRSNKGVYVCM